MGDGQNKNAVSSSWSLIEEVNLLKTMVICGQNWQEVSKQFEGRTPDECERHYYENFIDNPKLTELSYLLWKSRQNFHQFSKSCCQGLLPDSYCKCDELSSTSSASSSISKTEKGGVFDGKRDATGTDDEMSRSVSLFEEFNCCELGTSSKPFNSSTFKLNAVDLDRELFNCDNTLESNELENMFGGNAQSINVNHFETESKLKLLCDPSQPPKVLETPDNHIIDSKTSISESTHLESSCFGDDGSTFKFKAPYPVNLVKVKRKTAKRSQPDTSLSYSKRKVLESAPSSSSSISEKIGGVSLPQDSANKYEFYRQIAGFDANRTEFEIEYDNGAEEIFNSFRYELLLKTTDDDEDKSLVTELSLAMVKGYIHRLKERQRRKEIVYRFGLLNCFKVVSVLKALEVTFGKPFSKRLVRLKRLFSSQEYDIFLKGFQRFNQLKADFSKLCNYRELGITTLAAGNLYEEMSKMRNETIKQVQAIPLVKRLESGESVLGNHFRRPAPPIAVDEMPGYEALDKEEVEFCSLQRLVPKSYLEYKKTLISECEKRQGLKLAQARPLLKIDVNKTRKLYDLLLNKKLIWKVEKLTD